MKSLYLASLMLFVSIAAAQTTGDYRTNGTGGGNWNLAATWQRYNGSGWVPAATPPTGSELMTIQPTDSLNFNVTATVTGTLRNQGRVTSGVNLTIGNGGTFQHDQDAGSLPFPVWNDGSTLLITGSSGVAPTNKTQNFYNVTFDCPNLLSNLNMGWDSVTIDGTITVTNTGSARWQMAGPTAGDSSIFTLLGDIVVTGGAFSSNGTSNANTKIVIHQYGNINVTGGNLSVSRGSQGSGTGSTRWYLHEGNFSMSNAISQNSNPTNAWYVFDKAGTQTLTLGSGNTLTSLPIEVATGTTLDMGLSRLRGSGLFTLNAGATLVTGVDGGLDSAVSVGGVKTFSTDASFVFNGTGHQFTGTSVPLTVNNMTINNAAGVTLSQATTINGVLHLVAGVFDNTIPFTLGPSGSISFEGGSLLIPVDAVNPDDESLPVSFFVSANYPNPFNPSTTIQFGLPFGSFVTVKVLNILGQEVATLFEGEKEPGTHSIEFNASDFGSGVYLCRVQAGKMSGTTRMMLVK